MPNLYLLFSHRLTPEQDEDARRTLKVQEVVSLPEELQARWSNVPPEAETVDDYVRPILIWLREQVQPGDYVLVQGDFGMTYLTVTFAFEHGLIPVYSTTQRRTIETPQLNGTVQTQKVFRHVRYRKYSDSQGC